MDASTSVSQSAPSPNDSALDPDLRDLLSTASSFTHALSESGAFDDLSERETERFDATMALLDRGDPGSRRIGYLQVLDLLLADPERFTEALTTLHDQLAAADLPDPAPIPPASPQLDTLFVSPGVVRDLHPLVAAPVTRWIDGQLYVGSSAEQFERVQGIAYDQAAGRAWLTTGDRTQWLVLLGEVAAGRAA